jgi:hypothetical protein
MSWLLGIFQSNDAHDDGTFIRDAAAKYSDYYDGRLSWDQVRSNDCYAASRDVYRSSASDATNRPTTDTGGRGF